MGRVFISLLKKDFQMMLSGKFFLLALCSLILYSCYINFVYVNLDQDIYPVYLYDPEGIVESASNQIIQIDSIEELESVSLDGQAVGIDASGEIPKIIMTTSGLDSTDQLRGAYALSLLSEQDSISADIVGHNNKELKNRREITCEFLFFELVAVGFLGLASTLFKEKKMGVMRVHGVMAVSKNMFIISKIALFLLADILFACLLTIINLGFTAGITVLPAVLIQTCILSVIMALVGFFFAIRLHDFKQFSLLYLVLAIFVTTPVFLVGQTGVTWDWVNYHPMYHMFIAMKNAYFKIPAAGLGYYLLCIGVIVLLHGLVRNALIQEVAKEG